MISQSLDGHIQSTLIPQSQKRFSPVQNGQVYIALYWNLTMFRYETCRQNTLNLIAASIPRISSALNLFMNIILISFSRFLTAELRFLRHYPKCIVPVSCNTFRLTSSDRRTLSVQEHILHSSWLPQPHLVIFCLFPVNTHVPNNLWIQCYIQILSSLKNLFLLSLSCALSQNPLAIIQRPWDVPFEHNVALTSNCDAMYQSHIIWNSNIPIASTTETLSHHVIST
jgi:hypothetical protein